MNIRDLADNKSFPLANSDSKRTCNEPKVCITNMSAEVGNYRQLGDGDRVIQYMNPSGEGPAIMCKKNCMNS